MAGIKRTVADAAFSDTVRTRDRHTCQRCRKVYPERSAGLHCAHVVGRRNAALRYDLQNCISLCYPCHRAFDGEVLESADWFRNAFGDDRAEYLLTQKRVIVRHNEAMRKAVTQHYRGELARMRDDPLYRPENFDMTPHKKGAV